MSPRRCHPTRKPSPAGRQQIFDKTRRGGNTSHFRRPGPAAMATGSKRRLCWGRTWGCVCRQRLAVQLDGHSLATRSACLDQWAAGHRGRVPRSLASCRGKRGRCKAQKLLHIEPRRKKRAAAAPELEKHPRQAIAGSGTDTIPSADMAALATVGDVVPLEPNVALLGNQPTEEVHSSTNKPMASGQN